MKKFYRSSENKVFLGILGGLGEYFEVDPVVLRALAVVLCILTAFFPLFLAYILLAFIVPKNREVVKPEKEPKKLYRSSENKVFLGILGGLGEYFEVDPVVLRALAVVLCILTAFFPLFLAYILLAFIVPKNREDGKKNDKRPLYKKFWFWFIFLFIFVLSLFLAVLLGIIFSHNQIRKERDGVFIQYTYIDTEDEIKIFENIKKDGFVF